MDRRTIVVIEDEPATRSQAVDLFEAAGLNAVAFASGEEAIDFVRAHRDVVAGVFTDHKLEGESNGLEVANLVAEVLPEIAVVLTSGALTGRPDRLSPAVRFLAKPWSPLYVVNTVQDAKLEGPD